MGSLAAFTLRWVKTWVRISTESYKWCIKKINIAQLIFCSLWVRCNLYHHSNKFRPYIAAMIVLFISCFLYPFIHLTTAHYLFCLKRLISESELHDGLSEKVPGALLVTSEWLMLACFVFLVFPSSKSLNELAIHALRFWKQMYTTRLLSQFFFGRKSNMFKSAEYQLKNQGIKIRVLT